VACQAIVTHEKSPSHQASVDPKRFLFRTICNQETQPSVNTRLAVVPEASLHDLGTIEARPSHAGDSARAGIVDTECPHHSKPCGWRRFAVAFRYWVDTKWFRICTMLCTPCPLGLGTRTPDLYRVNLEFNHLKPFSYLAFPQIGSCKTAVNWPSFDGELMASFVCRFPLAIGVSGRLGGLPWQRAGPLTLGHCTGER
jgi:hypothetical protein